MIFFRQAIRLECCNSNCGRGNFKKREPVTEITQLVKMGTIQQSSKLLSKFHGNSKIVDTDSIFVSTNQRNAATREPLQVA